MTQPVLPPTIGDRIDHPAGALAVIGVISKRSRAGTEMAVVLATEWNAQIGAVLCLPAHTLSWDEGTGSWRVPPPRLIVVPGENGDNLS